MDRERLEAFRRKLREADTVRVVNGTVVLEDASGNKSHLGGQAPRAVPQGVRVKPHEWGAGPPALHTSNSGQKRILAEQGLLKQEYPGFSLDIDDDGIVFGHGWVGPAGALQGRYHVLVTLPPGYGQGVMPQVFVLEPELQGAAPHLFNDGSLCLDHSGAFTARSTLVTLLAWISVWLVLYEGWLETGTPW